MVDCVELLGVENESKEERYAYLCQILEDILDKSTAAGVDVGSVVRELPEPRDPNEYKHRLQQLQEGIIALQRKIENNEETGKTDDQSIRTPTPMESPDLSNMFEEKDIVREPRKGGKECMTILLPLLTASMRSVKFAQSKMLAMAMLTDFTKYLSDDVILQRVLPHFVNILNEASTNRMKGVDEEYACVISFAIRSITKILSNIASLPHSDFNVVTDYIIPNLITIQQK